MPENEDYSWYDYLYKLFSQDERFSVLVRPVSDWGGESILSMNILKAEDRSTLLLKHIDYLDKIGMKHHNGYKYPFSKICYASYPYSMVFRANGKIEKCTVCLNHPKNHFGWVDPQRGVVLDSSINNLWSFSQLKSECYTCPDVLACLNMQCKKSLIIDGQEENRCSHILSAIY